MRGRKWCGFVTSPVLFLLIGSFSAHAFEVAHTFEMRCSGCHSIGEGVRVGPDLKEVTKRRSEKWLLEFVRSPATVLSKGDKTTAQLVKEFNGIVMPDQDLSDDEIRQILKFIEAGGAPKAPASTTAEAVPATGTSPASGSSQADVVDEEDKSLLLALTKPFTFLADLGDNTGYKPVQPVNFSHKIHAGQNRIDCRYCHFGSLQSRHAGIPPANVCMNCHAWVKKDSPEIKKVKDALEQNKPIEWVRVHRMADFVYFNHAQHVKVGKLECQTCHGPVETMPRVYQDQRMSMGWCIDCHRSKEVQVHTKEGLKSMKVSEQGGMDCAKCHY